MGFRPSQQVFQSCRDETTDSLMLHSSMEEIKVSCVWAQNHWPSGFGEDF